VLAASAACTDGAASTAAIATASDKNQYRRTECLHSWIISSLATVSGIKRVIQVPTRTCHFREGGNPE
jgi:hypothetical protein